MWPVGRSRFISNAALTAVLLDHNSPWHPRHHHHHQKKKTKKKKKKKNVCLQFFFFFFFFFFFSSSSSFIINIINIIIIIITILSSSLISICRSVCCQGLKGIIDFSSMRQYWKQRAVFFYSFQNKSVFVKEARMESSWQDWHIKVNYVFGSTTDALSSLLYPVSTLLPPTIPLPPAPSTHF